ncbi:MAG TPA: hypothetical protein VL688_04390 [Verrucomicrobiae bacterium]|jgi:antitoxin component YwqK of YwqJK toxin-antitoxin module|nr:hypothetical protein [Verrucomicrobiae bacterium]
MRLFALLLCVLLTVAGCGKTKENHPDNGVKTTYFFKGGPMKSEQTYKNGQLNGVSTTYYKSGVVRSETEYKDGQIHGTVKRYAVNGQLAGEAKWENGKQVSEKRYQ